MNVTIQHDAQKKTVKVSISRAFKQLVRFGWEQALSCLFPVVIFASLAITQMIPLPFLPRYDWLLILFLFMQGWMVRSGLETWDELKVITLFHLIGLALEIFKVHMGSWAYPEEGYFKVLGVPLYSGFMYASVASYLCQAWRRLKVDLVKWPPFIVVVPLAAAIYLNFFTHHYWIDIRYWLAGLVIIVFWKSWVIYEVGGNSLSYANRTFFCAHRIFYMDSRKYCNILWGLEISKPSRCMESRTYRKGEFMGFTRDC